MKKLLTAIISIILLAGQFMVPVSAETNIVSKANTVSIEIEGTGYEFANKKECTDFLECYEEYINSNKKQYSIKLRLTEMLPCTDTEQHMRTEQIQAA